MVGANGAVKKVIDLVFWKETRKKTLDNKKGWSIMPKMRFLRKDKHDDQPMGLSQGLS